VLATDESIDVTQVHDNSVAVMFAMPTDRIGDTVSLVLVEVYDDVPDLVMSTRVPRLVVADHRLELTIANRGTNKRSLSRSIWRY